MKGCFIKDFRAPANCWDCWLKGIHKIIECYNYRLDNSNRDIGRPFDCPIREVTYEEMS